MKKFVVVLLLISVCLIAAARAEVPQISEIMFSNAKQALACLAEGEYEQILSLLPFSAVSPSASEWQNFAESNFTTLTDGVQTEYAVAYWTGTVWKLAVPATEPNDSSIETLVLTTADGVTFTGYRYAAWSEVFIEYQAASYVVWNKEYIPAQPFVIAG